MVNGSALAKKILHEQHVGHDALGGHGQAGIPVRAGLMPDKKPDQKQRENDGNVVRRQDAPCPAEKEGPRPVAKDAAMANHRQGEAKTGKDDEDRYR